MTQIRDWFGRQSDAQKKIVLAVCAILGVMILFPPKEVISRNPILGGSTSQSAGYHFILDDPAAGQRESAEKLFGKEADSLFGSGIEWGKLLIQLVFVGGAGFAVLQLSLRSRIQPA